MDTQYTRLPNRGPALEHHYGDRVHLLSFPWAMSMLTRLCDQGTEQPLVNDLVGALYDGLLPHVADHLFKRTAVEVPTRMNSTHPEGIYQGQSIDPHQRVVVVDLARAGILPSHRFYNGMHRVLEASSLRQDHVVASRTTDEQGRVTGVQFDGSKIGGPIDDATVIFPDPMAATGSSIAGVISHYLKEVGGVPRNMAAVHLIATPEYLRRMTTEFPELHIFAVRLDRGLSAPDVLQTTPGTRWDEERGLSDIQYIVPGAGGVGEVLNNAWV